MVKVPDNDGPAYHPVRKTGKEQKPGCKTRYLTFAGPDEQDGMNTLPLLVESNAYVRPGATLPDGTIFQLLFGCLVVALAQSLTSGCHI